VTGLLSSRRRDPSLAYVIRQRGDADVCSTRSISDTFLPAMIQCSAQRGGQAAKCEQPDKTIKRLRRQGW
jgi:hypothetical protein